MSCVGTYKFSFSFLFRVVGVWGWECVVYADIFLLFSPSCIVSMSWIYWNCTTKLKDALCWWVFVKFFKDLVWNVLCLKMCRLGMRLKPSVDLQPTQVAQATASKILCLVSWNFISLFSFNFLYMWFFWGLGGIVQVNMKLLLSICITHSIW